MENNTDPGKSNGNQAFTMVWLLVGLAPILILLNCMSNNGIRAGINPGLLFIVCSTCNLVGGIGCCRAIKDRVWGIFLGLLVGALFFAITWAIVLFQACSHMNI